MGALHNLTMIYQKPNELLREWLARYGEAIAATMDITDREALMGALSSMKKITPFKRELNRKPPSSYREFLARVQGYINAEEADANDPEHKSNKNKRTEQGSMPVKQDGKKRQGGGNGDKQPAATTSAPEAKKPRQEDTRVEEVFNQVGRGNLLRRPELMKSDPSRRNHKKFCRFHGDVGHHTNDCADLKDEIEYSHTDVAFNEDDASGVHFPHNDALVMEAMIGNHIVCRILVDNGSSVDLLYSDCLEKMGIQKEQLEKTSRPLYGFTGDSVIP
ncbi:uncharacterized protein LOC112090951 [Morus notabilis]|uniref:uncharacterized protein LOC112090951 n=1 Tax=Morus notabilis TaxID=981085 RepID=UPI000CED2E04|nr:uncharacterized protein LOC112090951 [Morus notabilis]